MKYQGVCLENVAGSMTMDNYDYLPPAARRALRYSNENLCPACLPKFLTEWTPEGCALAIARMEKAVRDLREGREPSF